MLLVIQKEVIFTEARVITLYLNPSIKNIVLWLDGINILANVQMIYCYYDYRGCINSSVKLCTCKEKVDISGIEYYRT